MKGTDVTENVPAWRLREELRRAAQGTIDGRAGFERHMGRLSDKPLQKVELDPREVIAILDEFDEAVRLKEEYHEQWMLTQRELEKAMDAKPLHSRRADGMELCEFDDEDWPCSWERARLEKEKT